jgi:hypothetical protein
MPISFSDLLLAFEFVSSDGMGENEAYLDRQSGKIYWHSEFGDNDEELPDDIDDEKYIAIPDKIELDLGKPLVLDFAREFLPDDYGEVCHIFSRRGAYRRYKDLLVRRGALERWYDFRTRPRKRLCGIGARRTGSTSAGPEIPLCYQPVALTIPESVFHKIRIGSGGNKSRWHCQLKRPWYARRIGGAAARVGELLCLPIMAPRSSERGPEKAPWVR